MSTLKIFVCTALAFNTTVASASVFGELAYRPNLPIGVATTNDLLGDLAVASSAVGFKKAGSILAVSKFTLGDEIHNVQAC